jgi:hypothetical protein
MNEAARIRIAAGGSLVESAARQKTEVLFDRYI